MELEERKIKVVFCGSSQFAEKILSFLLSLNFLNISLVVTHCPTHTGRGLKLKPSPVKELSRQNALKTLETRKITDELINCILDQKVRLFIICDSALFVPDAIRKSKEMKTINIHPSLLPRWRGPNPIRSTLLNGDSQAGVTLMELAREIDAGRIYSQKKCSVFETDNFQSLSKKLLTLSFSLLKETIPLIVTDKVKPLSQNSDEATWSRKLTKKDEILDLSQKFWLQVRALSPTPGAYLMWQNTKLKILKLSPEVITFKKPFESGIYWIRKSKKLVLSGTLGAKEILLIQKAGKKPVDGKSFFNGYQKEIKAL